jgi:hypothetical protein
MIFFQSAVTYVERAFPKRCGLGRQGWRFSASTHHTPDDSGFSGLVLTVSGSHLVWDINGSGHKGTFEK